jgi:hypothetical protein
MTPKPILSEIGAINRLMDQSLISFIVLQRCKLIIWLAMLLPQLSMHWFAG